MPLPRLTENAMKGEFYRMDFDAWDEGTDDLTLEQEAAYLRLCHQMYRRRGPIPKRLPALARMWRCHPNKARKLLADLIDSGKIEETPEGHLTNTRVRQEIDHRETMRTQRAHAAETAGRRSGDVRRKSLISNDLPGASGSTPTNQNELEREGEGEREGEREEERKIEMPDGLDPWEVIALERAAEAAANPASGQAADPSTKAGLDPSPPAPPAAPPEPEYAFAEGVIRLNARDLATWKARYPNLDLEAELVSLTRWAADEVAKTGGSWFHPVQGALAKRNREAKARSEQIRVRAETETKQLGKPRRALV